MHELLREMLQDAPPSHHLARFPLDDGAMVAMFTGGGQPRWVAKTAENAAGIVRLRAEARALGALEPLAQALGVPRLLGWREEDERACLVQSGVPGRPAFRRPRQHGGALPTPTLLAGGWLHRLQGLAPPPRRVTLAELAQQAQQRAQEDWRRHPEAGPLLSGLLPALEATPASVGAEIGAVAIHGDFWAGNLLLTEKAPWPPELYVIDWCGFDAGSALEDVFTWIAHLDACDRRPEQKRLQRWQRSFFLPGAATEYLRTWRERIEYPDVAARLAFYLFLLRRMSWELGLGLQHRGPAERECARAEWEQVVGWLAAHRYPDPFLPMPQ